MILKTILLGKKNFINFEANENSFPENIMFAELFCILITFSSFVFTIELENAFKVQYYCYYIILLSQFFHITLNFNLENALDWFHVLLCEWNAHMVKDN